MHRKEMIHSDGSSEKKSRRRAWQKKWDKVKFHRTLIDWCTGREWPVNCMAVISVWWRSNMPFQRLNGWFNYYITRCGQEVSQLDIRWVRDKMWLRKTPLSRRGHWDPRLSLETSWWEDAGMRTCPREDAPPRPPVEQPSRTRTTHGNVRRGCGGHYVAVLFGLQLPLTPKPYNKWEVHIFLKVCVGRYYCVSICILHIYVLCVCIVNQGHGYTTHTHIYIYIYIYIIENEDFRVLLLLRFSCRNCLFFFLVFFTAVYHVY